MQQSVELSVQLYSLRHEGDLATQLMIARTSGFKKVELIERQLEKSVTAAMLTSFRLETRSAHVSFESLAERPGTLVAAAQKLGVELLVVPAPPEKYRSGEADWRDFASELATIAQDVRNEGGRLAYHNHHWELAEIAHGGTALDHILETGSKQGLEWQGDLAWLIRGGGDPLTYIERWGERLTSIHIKDIALPGAAKDEDGWADVGHGIVDWTTLWQAAYGAGVRLMVAEHDAPGDGVRFCNRSIRTMQKLLADVTK